MDRGVFLWFSSTGKPIYGFQDESKCFIIYINENPYSFLKVTNYYLFLLRIAGSRIKRSHFREWYTYIFLHGLNISFEKWTWGIHRFLSCGWKTPFCKIRTCVIKNRKFWHTFHRVLEMFRMSDKIWCY